MKDDWVQEPDDVEWSHFMHWVPDLDIVPFRPEEFVPWRLREIRLGIASLNRQWDTVCRDGRIRLREFERERGLPLSWAWEDPPTPETGSPMQQAADAVSGLGHAARCAREIVEALRVLDPGVPADYLDAVPAQLLDAVVAGVPANVQLPSGQEAEVRTQWNGELEAHLVPVAAGIMWSWFRRMMDQFLDPEPVPGTFLASVAEQQAPRDREVPGIQSWSRTGNAPPPEPGTPPGASLIERVREDYEARTGRRWRDMVQVPSGPAHCREAAVWQDQGLSERIRQGFREAVAGTTVSRGDFQQYLSEDTGQEGGPDMVQTSEHVWVERDLLEQTEGGHCLRPEGTVLQIDQFNQYVRQLNQARPPSPDTEDGHGSVPLEADVRGGHM